MPHRPEGTARSDEELNRLTAPLPTDAAFVAPVKPGEHVGVNFFKPFRPRPRKKTPSFWDLIARR